MGLEFLVMSIKIMEVIYIYIYNPVIYIIKQKKIEDINLTQSCLYI